MSTVDPNYTPLHVSLSPGTARTSRELRLIKRGTQAWTWADPWRRTHLPALVVLVEESHPHVLVRWVDSLGMTEPDPDDPRKAIAPKLGTTGTPTDGVGPVILTFSRTLFTEVDPTNWIRVIQHEIGHALGLRHDDGGIMYPHIDTTPTAISQGNREKAAALRLRGVVGVDSERGN